MGCKGWGHTEVATRLAWNFVELRVFTLAITDSFTAGEKRSIVTTGALLQVSVERRPFYLYRSIDVIACTPFLF